MENAGEGEVTEICLGSLSDPFRLSGTDCDADLGLSESCSVEVELAPGSATLVSSDFSVEYFDARRSRTVSIQLRGKGAIPTLFAGSHSTGSVFLLDPLTETANNPSFTALGGVQGVSAASGDVNGDRYPDLIVGAGPGSRPYVKVYPGRTETLLYQFDAYDPNFNNGVAVAAADLDGDGYGEIIVGAGNHGLHVRTYRFENGALAAQDNFFALTPSAAQNQGVRVTALNLDLDGTVKIICQAGQTHHVRVWNPAAGFSTPVSTFSPGQPFHLSALYR